MLKTAWRQFEVLELKRVITLSLSNSSVAKSLLSEWHTSNFHILNSMASFEHRLKLNT